MLNNEDIKIMLKKHDDRIKSEMRISTIIEEVTETICDNFCKYRNTVDVNCECEWMRKGHKCPLDRL